MTSNFTSRRRVILMRQISKACYGLAIGLASLSVTALSSLPELVRHPPLAKLYAEAIQNGAFGAVGAAVLGAMAWSLAADVETNGDSPRTFSLTPAKFFGAIPAILVGTAALLMTGTACSRLLDLSNQLVASF